jgi:hypothetical protein
MKSLKISLLALVGAFLFVSSTASAQQATASVKKAPAKTEAKPVLAADKNAKLTAPSAAAKVSPVTTEGQNMKPSDITWTEDVHNFGDIEKGKPVTHDFTFKNTTKQTVLITNVKPSCGCTAANYTKTPIKPGETGVVSATFNAASAAPFTKTVTVTTNDSDVKKVLTIKGKVLEAPGATPAATPQN